jgi:hypothetical protein
MRSSSGAGPRSRGRPAPERGGASPEGGDRLSSEAVPHLKGRPTLEQGGTSLEEASSPRARRKFASVVSCPSSEAKFQPTAWWAVGATRAVGP